MVYNMRLNNEPFELIKNGTKTIELRLNDEKRSLIKTGDIVLFTNRITKEVIKTRVIRLHKYDSFEELFKHFNSQSLGYLNNDPNPKDMELYYSKEDQKKYGVLGIEIELLNKNKKEIVNNLDNLSINDVNRVVRRAKLLIQTSDNKVAICHSSGNYHLLGGHVENDETDIDCLNREIKEEAGVDLELNDLNPFITIKYLNKDYPDSGVNTFTMANYYSIIYDLKPNLDNIHLTKDEKQGNFIIEFIDLDKALDTLEKSLSSATRKGVTLDTIEVIKEYLDRKFTNSI